MKINWFKKYEKILLLFLLLLLCAVLIVKYNADNAYRSKTGGAFLTFFSPIFKVFKSIEDKAAEPFFIFFQGVRLDDENKSLKREIARLKADNNILRDSFDILTSQTQMLYVYKERNYNFIGAETLFTNSSKLSRTIIIDKGMLHGVRANLPAVNNEGLVGIVKVVSEKSATIQCLIDSGSFVGGKILETGDKCLIYGTGKPTELHIKLEILSPDIKIGYKVVTSGIQNSLYPPGLAVGKIREFKIDQRGNRFAVVKPDVNFQKISNVLIISETQY